MPLYALTIFASAFLLFQVEPVIAKIILPWFGGTAAVWTTCLLFFQVVLLLGYLYAHLSMRFLTPKRQRWFHVCLLAASVPLLHVLPSQSWKPVGNADPTFGVLMLLLLTVGLPFFLLSTTGPLLQAWYATGRSAEGGAKPFPYRLYALSNAGSLLALLSYPFVFEPRFTLRHQAFGWMAGYVLFVVLCAAVALRERGNAWAPVPEAAGSDSEEAVPAPGIGKYLHWIGLSACSSMLLLSITNHLSQNVAAIPFLWILPLSLYLISFIVCFGGKGWRWDRAFLPFPMIAVVAMTFALTRLDTNLRIWFLIPLFAAGLFVCCMVCHGELAVSKPAPRHLTVFYLMISVGGALGGIFVGLIAPHIFRDYYELPIGIAACAVYMLFVLYREPKQKWSEPNWLTLAAFTGALLVFLGYGVRAQSADFTKTVRNFYGVLHISDSDDPTDENAYRTLTHGTIRHGEQFLSASRRMDPTTYYGPDSGVARTIKTLHAESPLRVGVIGLGTGTLAAYGKPGDVYRFYDINPLVVQLAGTEFSFLRDSKAHTETVIGDARLSLEREPPQNYDVLAVDAFSSDAIPVHLLTKEAFDLYFRQLKPGGVLAVHVSNVYLDLAPVVAKLAQAEGKEARLVENEDDDPNEITSSDWVLVTGRRDLFAMPLLKDVSTPIDMPRNLLLWTDDYSNLFQIFKKPSD